MTPDTPPAEPPTTEAPQKRLPPLDPIAFDDAQRQLYENYASGQRAQGSAGFRLVTDDGALIGPPAAWMLSPQLGLGLERAGYALRFGLSLSARLREIVILLVAAAEDSDFERFAHRQAARAAGLADSEIAALESGGAFNPRDDAEHAVVVLTGLLLRTGTLDDAQWSAARDALGHQGVFEVVTLVGWYRLMALQLRVFALEPPAEQD